MNQTSDSPQVRLGGYFHPPPPARILSVTAAAAELAAALAVTTFRAGKASPMADLLPAPGPGRALPAAPLPVLILAPTLALDWFSFNKPNPRLRLGW